MRNDLLDSRRTIPAAVIGGVRHSIYHARGFENPFTRCGLIVTDDELLIFRQYPSDIDCPTCQGQVNKREGMAGNITKRVTSNSSTRPAIPRGVGTK